MYRPAAIDQLETLGKQLDVAVFSDRENKDPVSIAQKGIAYAKQHGFTAVIIDTAGRLAIDEAMMDEIARVKKAIQPQETLFVVDAMTGQDAVNTAKAFNERLEHRRRGADQAGRRRPRWCGALHPQRGGQADQVHRHRARRWRRWTSSIPSGWPAASWAWATWSSLVEKAQEQFDEKAARELQKKIAKDQFGFDDFLDQIAADQEDGEHEGPHGHDPRRGQGAEEHRHPRRRLQGHRGHHQEHDPRGAPEPRPHQRQPPATHRQGQRHQRPRP